MMCTCWGMKLRTAGIVVGWIELVSAALGVLVLLYFINDDEYRTNYSKNVIDDDDSKNVIGVDYKDPLWPTVFFWFDLASCIFNIITSVALLIGIHKNRPALFIPWLIESALTIICYIFIIIYYIVVGDTDAVIYVITGALQIWCFRIIYLLHQDLKSQIESAAENRADVRYSVAPKI